MLSLKMADKETKSLIRSCLISTKGSLSLRELKRDFQTLVGYPVPFRDNGFRNLEDYLRSIPDVVRLDESGPEPQVQFVADASTAGIASLVQRQKSTKKKLPLRRPVAYVPRSTYGAYRRPGGYSAPRFDFQPLRTFNVRPGPRPGSAFAPGPRFSQPGGVRPSGHPGGGQPQRPPAPAPRAQAPPSRTLQPQQQQQKQYHQPREEQQQQQPARRSPEQSEALRPRAAPAASAQSWWGQPTEPSPPLPSPPAAQTRSGAQQPPAGQLNAKQQLQAFIREHGLPEAKLETVSFKPKSVGHVTSFYSRIVVGDVRCQTYPAESPSEATAETMVCQMALDELRQRQQQDSSRRESPVTQDPQLIVSRIGQLLETRQFGLWRDTVPDEYRRRFHERVPDNWEDLLYNSGTVRFDCVGTDRYILYSTVPSASGGAGDGDGVSPKPPASPAAGQPDCLTRLETVALPEDELFPVYVTWVFSGSKLAFRLIGEQYTDRLDDLLSEMEVSMVDDRRPVSPVIGGYYLAQVDGAPHRVQVLSILDDTVSAFFVDIGDTELVPTRQLSPLDAARFGQLPGQALHASLSGVDPDRPGAQHALSQLALRKSLICQAVEASDSRLEVVLYDTSGEDDVNINQTLQELAEADALPSLPPVGGIVDAFVVHVARQTGDVFVQLDSAAAQEVIDRVLAAAEAAAAAPPAAPQQAGLFLALYSDGSWYRARVLAPPSQETVPVLFVDYGNEETVPVTALRPLPDSLSLPAQALAVRLSDVQMTEAAALRLIQMVPMDGTRVVLRVTSNPPGGVPEVEAYKRLDNNELVSINATLMVEAQMSGRTERASRQSSTTSATAARPSPPVSRQSSSASLSGGGPPARSPSPTEQLLRQTAAAGAEPDLGQLQLQALEQYRVQQGDGYLDVAVSFCSSPWNIYVQPYLEGGKLRALMHSMQEYYNQPANTRPLRPDNVASGQFCAVKNPEDELWYRARVETRLDNDQVTIKFVDYGDFSYVPLEPGRVQPLPSSFRRLPTQAVKARLGGVRPAGSDWTIDDCIELQRLLAAGVFVAELLERGVDSITGEQLVLVRLVDTSGPTDVYVDRLLVGSGHAVHTGRYFAS